MLEAFLCFGDCIIILLRLNVTGLKSSLQTIKSALRSKAMPNLLDF